MTTTREVPNTKAEPFELGQVVGTATIDHWAQHDDLAVRAARRIWMGECLQRHADGDFGDIDGEDWEANTNATLKADPQRVLSAYLFPVPEWNDERASNDRIWIITEYDRSATTILFPRDY